MEKHLTIDELHKDIKKRFGEDAYMYDFRFVVYEQQIVAPPIYANASAETIAIFQHIVDKDPLWSTHGAGALIYSRTTPAFNAFTRPALVTDELFRTDLPLLMLYLDIHKPHADSFLNYLQPNGTIEFFGRHGDGGLNYGLHAYTTPKIGGHSFRGGGTGAFIPSTNEYMITGTVNNQAAILRIDAANYTFKDVVTLSGISLSNINSGFYLPVTNTFIIAASGSRAPSAGYDGGLILLSSGNTGYVAYGKLIKVSDDVYAYPLDVNGTRIEASGFPQDEKDNDSSDGDYIPPQYDTGLCPI